MFCHYCGKKLVSGARFCSWCSTPVPVEILEEMEQASGEPAEIKSEVPESVRKPGPEPVKEPEPEPVKEPEPEPVKEPEPEPVKGPEPAPVKEPEPEPVKEPEPEPVKEPEPEPVKEPEPEPVKEPEPEPVKEPEPEPVKEPEPEPVKEPEPIPMKEPEPKPEADLPEEEIVMLLSVTKEQIEKEETIVLKHDALMDPMNLTLRKGMKEMMRLRLTNARMKPVPGKKPVLVVKLHVKASPVPPAPKPVPQPAPAPKSVPVSPPRAPKTVSFSSITFPCAFQLCPQGNLKTGYHFGGADDEGNIDLSPSVMAVYRKSKMVGAAFGLIGSAIEGKGKQIAAVHPQNITSFEKEAKKHNIYEYRIYLKDRQVLKLLASDSRKVSVISTIDKFLSQV